LINTTKDKEGIMKKVLLAVCLTTLIGCASMRNTINRLQGDIDYFDKKMSKYYLIVKSMEGYGVAGHGDADKAKEAYLSAKYLLAKVKRAQAIGDEITKKKNMSALVDVLDLLEKYGD
jgi:hypothetical protein